MSTRYYVEVDVDPVEEGDFLSIEKKLSGHIDEHLTCDLHPGPNNRSASWHGWMDVFTSKGTKGTHADITTTIRELLPDAHVSTRWICWEELAFDAEHNTEEEEG